MDVKKTGQARSQSQRQRDKGAGKARGSGKKRAATGLHAGQQEADSIETHTQAVLPASAANKGRPGGKNAATAKPSLPGRGPAQAKVAGTRQASGPALQRPQPPTTALSLSIVEMGEAMSTLGARLRRKKQAAFGFSARSARSAAQAFVEDEVVAPSGAHR